MMQLTLRFQKRTQKKKTSTCRILYAQHASECQALHWTVVSENRHRRMLALWQDQHASMRGCQALGPTMITMMPQSS